MNSAKTLLRWSICLIFALTGFRALPANGTQTQIWTVSTFDEFRRGEVENVSLSDTGEIMLAPHSEQILTLKDQDLFVWAFTEDSHGNLYAGTGEQGKIFKIAPDGEVSLFFDSPEIGILSLAVDATDNVYAGSAPDGLIYKITPEGSQTTFFSTGAHYVWALAVDADNALYAGTGESGKIFKIAPDGTGTLLYDSPQSHVMSLLYDPQGWLYAGTEGKGIVYKIDADGGAFALYNAKEEEIHSLALDKQSNLYIGTITSKFSPKTKDSGATQQQPASKEKGLKKSSIYQISPAGTVTTVLELPEILIYAMIVDAKDQLLIGTDKEGMLYRVFPNGEYHQVLGVKTGSILSLLKQSSGNILVGTGDAGAVFRLSSQAAEQGSYLSSIHDVKMTATWGKIYWRETTTSNQIALSTRTGNTSLPDDTWSPWSEELHNKEGDSISNPPARFIQWKAVLTKEEQQSPVLEEVSIAYLPNNLVPKIQQIALYYAADNKQPGSNSRTNSSSSSSRSSNTDVRKKTDLPKPPKYIPPGYIAVVWEAEDPNDEELLYTVSLRGENDSKWNVLEEEILSPLYMLDTATLPDGGYYIKITAADTPNNPPKMALSAEKVSERFEIDNTPPEISIALNQKQGNKAVLVTVIAQDDSSRLQSAEYSVDAGEWIAIFPDDQVTDSQDEKYSISLADLTPDEHVLIFRAMDMYTNIGVGQIRFSTSGPQPEPQPPQK